MKLHKTNYIVIVNHTKLLNNHISEFLCLYNLSDSFLFFFQ
jgi:hypothetical protein